MNEIMKCTEQYQRDPKEQLHVKNVAKVLNVVDFDAHVRDSMR